VHVPDLGPICGRHQRGATRRHAAAGTALALAFAGVQLGLLSGGAIVVATMGRRPESIARPPASITGDRRCGPRLACTGNEQRRKRARPVALAAVEPTLHG
jgi:hypothetical protein